MGLLREGPFPAIDRELPDFLLRLNPGESDEVLLAAAMLSYAYRQGDVCIKLDNDFLPAVLEGFEAPTALPELNAESLKEKLEASPLVGGPGSFKPMILDSSGRLYFQKLWKHEQKLAAAILKRARKEPRSFDSGQLKDSLERMFSVSSPGTDWQKVAAVAAMRNSFTVISGGPGTGKTTTIAKVLALLLEQEDISQGDLTVALAAPTGKAAARLKQSISASLVELDTHESVKVCFPEKALTLHQLLGARRSSARFKYNEENPLPYDVVVVDEASMVDQGLMYRLMGALPESSRIILLGDKDQLASVEAGSVLGDICGNRGSTISTAFDSVLQDLGMDIPENSIAKNTYPLADAIVLLEKNYRFGEESGIAKAAEAINRGDGETLISILHDEAYGDIRLHVPGAGEKLEEEVADRLGNYFKALEEDSSVGEVFERFRQFQLLTTHRRGPVGVESLNRRIEARLQQLKLITPYREWYQGKPIIINENDYSLNLNNGDIGICLYESTGEAKVVFNKEVPIKLSPARLPAHDLAYTLTIHKSQGSEFDEVLIVLPGSASPLLSRPLLYTAVTRARKTVRIASTEERIKEAVGTPLKRASGLMEILWN